MGRGGRCGTFDLPFHYPCGSSIHLIDKTSVLLTEKSMSLFAFVLLKIKACAVLGA